MANSLHSIGILITRPQHQAQNLCKLLKSHGANPILLPTIAIEPICDQKQLSQQIQQLNSFAIAIFCSANALWQTEGLLKKYWPQLPKDLKLASIGIATKNALEKAGYSVTIYPKDNFNSEALVSLAELQQIKNKKIIIFSGKNGRDLLPQILTQRGAIVTKLDCYQRVQTQINPKPIIEQWQRDQIQFVICTSNEALSNLYALLDISGQKLLRDTQIIGVSDRIKGLAIELGCNKIPIIAAQASDQAICAAILTA